MKEPGELALYNLPQLKQINGRDYTMWIHCGWQGAGRSRRAPRSVPQTNGPDRGRGLHGRSVSSSSTGQINQLQHHPSTTEQVACSIMCVRVCGGGRPLLKDALKRGAPQPNAESHRRCSEHALWPQCDLLVPLWREANTWVQQCKATQLSSF